VDGRIHDCGLAIIVSGDPARNMMRDSNIAVRATGRAAVPPRQLRHGWTHHHATEPPDSLGSEVRVELIPGVAHRRQTVAEMDGASRPNDRFGAAVAHADDDVEPVEVELLDGRREERQIVPVVLRYPRQSLDERR